MNPPSYCFRITVHSHFHSIMLDGILSVRKFLTGVSQLAKARAGVFGCRIKSFKVRQKMKFHRSETNEQLSPAAQRYSDHLIHLALSCSSHYMIMQFN